MSLFSIVIPTINNQATLLRCLEAAFSSPDVEVFVIDNGGTDGTSEAVRSRFPQAVVLRNEINMGFARAVNRGLERARGRFLCLLNDDAVLSPDTLHQLAEFLDHRPDVGIVGPQLLHADGSKQNSIDNFPTLADQLFNKSVLRLAAPGRYPSKRQTYGRPVPVESIIGACMVIRRELYEKLGGLDERYFVFLEETDYCLRARRAGYSTYFFPGATVRHDQGMTGTKRAPHRTKVEYLRSMRTFFQIHRGILSQACYGLALPVKTIVQLAGALAGSILTLGLARSVRTRLKIQAWVFLWLLTLCPEDMGLKHARL